jgi:hypothetical protein
MHLAGKQREINPFSTATPENCLRIWRASSSGFIIAPRLNK